MNAGELFAWTSPVPALPASSRASAQGEFGPMAGHSWQQELERAQAQMGQSSAERPPTFQTLPQAPAPACHSTSELPGLRRAQLMTEPGKIATVESGHEKSMHAHRPADLGTCPGHGVGPSQTGAGARLQGRALSQVGGTGVDVVISMSGCQTRPALSGADQPESVKASAWTAAPVVDADTTRDDDSDDASAALPIGLPAVVPFHDQSAVGVSGHPCVDGKEQEVKAVEGGARPASSEAAEPEPVRLHANWTVDGVRLWLGMDFSVLTALPPLAAGLQHWLGSQGVRLVSLRCNGQPVIGGAGLTRIYQRAAAFRSTTDINSQELS